MNHEGGEEGIDHEGGEAGIDHEGGEAGMNHEGREEGIDHEGGEEGINHEGREEGMNHEGGEEGMNHEGGEEGILPGMITTVPSVAGTRRAKKGPSSRVSLRHFGRRLELESVFRVLRAYCGNEPDVYLG